VIERTGSNDIVILIRGGARGTRAAKQDVGWKIEPSKSSESLDSQFEPALPALHRKRGENQIVFIPVQYSEYVQKTKGLPLNFRAPEGHMGLFSPWYLFQYILC
jgi:hypothetical protein